MSPEQLEKLAEDIGLLRLESLFDESGDTYTLAPEAEQFYLLALAALETAQRFATLALYGQRKAVGRLQGAPR